MNHITKACVAICATSVASGIASAQPQIVISPRLAHDAAEVAHMAREESLQAEARASYLPRRDLRRTASAQASIRAREDARIAAYEQFKFDQQLALAEASSTKIYIWNNYTPANDSLETVPSKVSAVRRSSMRKAALLPPNQNEVRIGTRTSAPAYLSRSYPNSFYRKQAQERGTDRLIERVQRQDEINSRAREQRLISTQNGYIDVSDHRSGDMARDPYTGQAFRVP